VASSDEKPIDICCPLLHELVTRWSPNDESFRIRKYLIPLCGLNICKGLTLGISSEVVRFEDNNEGLVRNLFKGNDITVGGVVDELNNKKINRKKDVDNFCRLYILPTFVVFYFPRIVSTYHFHSLDSLEDLHIYNWDGAILSMLVSSLDRCSENLHRQRNVHGLYLCGCVPVLQVSIKFWFRIHW